MGASQKLPFWVRLCRKAKGVFPADYYTSETSTVISVKDKILDLLMKNRDVDCSFCSEL